MKKIDELKDDEFVDAIEDYLTSLQNTLYPYGLHAIGKNWTDDEIAMLVTSILSIPIEISPKVETTLQDEISMLICGKNTTTLHLHKKKK